MPILLVSIDEYLQHPLFISCSNISIRIAITNVKYHTLYNGNPKNMGRRCSYWDGVKFQSSLFPVTHPGGKISYIAALGVISLRHGTPSLPPGFYIYNMYLIHVHCPCILLFFHVLHVNVDNTHSMYPMMHLSFIVHTGDVSALAECVSWASNCIFQYDRRDRYRLSFVLLEHERHPVIIPQIVWF